MRALITTTLSVLAFVTYSQYRFDHLDIKDGLSQNSVNDIYQDTEGYLWFATQDGLNRYDGNEFTKYMTDGALSVSDNFLWDITEDRDGNIWVASRNGATRLDWKSGKCTKFYLKQELEETTNNNQVEAIIKKGDSLILAYHSAQSVTIHPNEYIDSSQVVFDIKPKILSGNLMNYIEVAGRKCWLFDDYIMLDKQKFLLPREWTTSRNFSELLAFNNGLFVGTYNGLLYFDLQSSSFTDIKKVGSRVTDIVLVDDKTLWVGSNEGIAVVDLLSLSVTHHIQSEPTAWGLTHNQIASIYKSRDGLIWVGSSNEGLNIYDPSKEQFKYLNEVNGLSSSPVWSILEMDSTLWLGMSDGLYKVSLRNEVTKGMHAKDAVKSIEELTNSEVKGRITGVFELDSERLLIGASDLVLLDKKRLTFKIFDLKRPDNLVTDVLITDTTVWITTHHGLYTLNPTTEKLKKVTKETFSFPFDPSYFLSVFQSKDHHIWLGSNIGFYEIISSTEIKHYPYLRKDPSHSPAFNFITGFFEDPKGQIWMSTFGGGVSCLNRKDSTFFHIGTEQGLSNNVCSSIQGSKSHLWVSTNLGLNRINIETNQVTSFDVSDGLVSNEFAIGASHKNNGVFYFGTVNGMIAFDPKDVKPLTYLEAPVITGLSVNYSESAYSRLAPKLHLYPQDKIFTFEFSQLSYRGVNGYQYRMIGFDNNWVSTSPTNRKSTYSLPSGSYEYQVRATKGNRISETAILSIVIHPAFYQTWWFYTVSILSAIIFVILVSRYYSHESLKKRLRKLEVQQRIQSERERISRDLHDNVGSQITYIATSLDNYSLNADPGEIKELGEFTRDTMRQLRETIWVINHDEVSIYELKTKVVDYLSEVLKNFPDIIHQVRFPESELKLNPTKAINIFRIIQEAVNNSLKHAQPTLIKIEFLVDETCTIAISDDGKGFDGENRSGHYGLINMRSRAQEIGGVLSLKSIIGKGTSIIVSGFKIGQMT